jgi:hypothetical protein
MHERLQAIQGKRTRLFEIISTVEPRILTARPAPEKWSIQEIVEHLVLAEVDVLGDLHALAERRPLRRGLRDRVLYLVVMFILRFDIPVKAPSSGMLPKGDRALERLRADWEANHRLLTEWIEASDPRAVDRPLFAHPVAGAMTTAEALRMLEVHLDRHIRQIRAIIGQTPVAGPA